MTNICTRNTDTLGASCSHEVPSLFSGPRPTDRRRANRPGDPPQPDGLLLDIEDPMARVRPNLVGRNQVIDQERPLSNPGQLVELAEHVRHRNLGNSPAGPGDPMPLPQETSPSLRCRAGKDLADCHVAHGGDVSRDAIVGAIATGHEVAVP